jgi:tetratricopeptide (TPR) repeat protein
MGEYKKYIREMDRGNYALALTILDHEIQKNPNNPELLYNFAICCSRTENHKKCLSVLEDLLARFDRFIERDNIYRLIIYTLIHLHEYIKALELTDERLKINVGDLRLLSFRGHILEKLGKLEEALIIHRNILKIRPDYINSLNSTAYLISVLPNPSEEDLALANNCIKKALAGDLNNPAYLDTFGVILKLQGNHEAAKRAFQKAISRSPKVNSVILEHLQELL